MRVMLFILLAWTALSFPVAVLAGKFLAWRAGDVDDLHHYDPLAGRAEAD